MTNAAVPSTASLTSKLHKILMLVLICALTVLGVAAQAHTYTVLHNFTGGTDGGAPWSGVTLDKAGNIYGTTTGGGGPGCGVVYKLTNRNNDWVLTTLHQFTCTNDGHDPMARVIFGPDGSLYGTTYSGGTGNCFAGCGVVFKLTPPPTPCKATSCPWQETVLHYFLGLSDGALPGWGDLLLDSNGNIYGTTTQGGDSNCGYQGIGCGTVYKLSPSGSGWNISVLYAFTGVGMDEASPNAGVIRDAAGNLYGTTQTGGGQGDCSGHGCGTVFQLTPQGQELTLYSFRDQGDGADPTAGVIFDQSGRNLIGASNFGQHGGAVFEVTLQGVFNSLYAVAGVYSSLVMDASGSVYGTDYAYPDGHVFKLTPNGGTWIFTDLHDFTGSDGENPTGSVTFDAHGNLYGTTVGGGMNYSGVVWEITP